MTTLNSADRLELLLREYNPHEPPMQSLWRIGVYGDFYLVSGSCQDALEQVAEALKLDDSRLFEEVQQDVRGEHPDWTDAQVYERACDGFLFVNGAVPVDIDDFSVGEGRPEDLRFRRLCYDVLERGELPKKATV